MDKWICRYMMVLHVLLHTYHNVLTHDSLTGGPSPPMSERPWACVMMVAKMAMYVMHAVL